jgi:AGCS family alanine or glycine:cation symporter
LHALRLAIVVVVFLGATAPGATAVFFFSDPLMGLLAVVNLMAIIMLFPVAMRVLDDFRGQLKSGVQRPVFQPAAFPDLDLDHSAWPHAHKSVEGSEHGQGRVAPDVVPAMPSPGT